MRIRQDTLTDYQYGLVAGIITTGILAVILNVLLGFMNLPQQDVVKVYIGPQTVGYFAVILMVVITISLLNKYMGAGMR